MLKKLLVPVFAVILCAFTLTGCKEHSSVEKFTEKYYKAWVSGEMTAHKSYDEYISQTSKDLLSMSQDDYVNSLVASMRDTKIKDIEILNVTDFNATVYKVKCSITMETNGKEQAFSSNEYVINENGNYKFLMYGVNAKQDVETKYSSKEFSMAIDALYSGPDSVMVHLIAKNPTTSAYAVGFGGDAKIVVETDKGTFESKLEGTNIIQPIDGSEGMQTINGVRGNIKTITIYNIYELNAAHQPNDINNARSYLLYKAPEE